MLLGIGTVLCFSRCAAVVGAIFDAIPVLYCLWVRIPSKQKNKHLCELSQTQKVKTERKPKLL